LMPRQKIIQKKTVGDNAAAKVARLTIFFPVICSSRCSYLQTQNHRMRGAQNGDVISGRRRRPDQKEAVEPGIAVDQFSATI